MIKLFLGEPHIALFDFKPQDYRELALHKGELVRVTYIDNGGWVKALNEQNVQGWIPHNFVTPIDPEKYSVIKKSVEVYYCHMIIKLVFVSNGRH